ncbi:DNA-formamidopyrimidine glycosylase family protein [Longispora albida]|uniref:DNA-formamidopyrimidine glycosylase family protein n=1 Tax=Longispora albida TaxID=203523 RepID=UPI0003753AC2|nr:DNA-formamidopyrimidine glycosylase family protein [Longispora albida]
MPEGDSVLRTARRLGELLTGQALTSSDFRVPQLATADLSGWVVRESAARGKHLLLRFDREYTLHSHLRMDGSWRAYRAGERWTGGPGHLIRVVLGVAGWAIVGYHLHELAIVPTARENDLVGHLGPDLLGSDWDASEAARRIAARPEVPIGEALMDQRNLAGIGNIFKAETLFRARVSPYAPAGTVPDLAGLVTIAQELLSGSRQPLVYGKRICPRCRGLISRDTLAGRVTYWCPSCQRS